MEVETLSRGRGEGGAGVLTSGACDEGGVGGVEVRVEVRARARGGGRRQGRGGTVGHEGSLERSGEWSRAGRGSAGEQGPGRGVANAAARLRARVQNVRSGRVQSTRATCSTECQGGLECLSEAGN